MSAEETGGMIEYRVLELATDLDKDAWADLGTFKARNPREAIRAALKGSEENREGAKIAAIPTRNWNEETVTVKTEPVVAFA